MKNAETVIDALGWVIEGKDQTIAVLSHWQELAKGVLEEIDTLRAVVAGEPEDGSGKRIVPVVTALITRLRQQRDEALAELRYERSMHNGTCEAPK